MVALPSRLGKLTRRGRTKAENAFGGASAVSGVGAGCDGRQATTCVDALCVLARYATPPPPSATIDGMPTATLGSARVTFTTVPPADAGMR